MTPDLKTIKRLWGYLKPYWRLELLALFAMCLLAALALALPISIQYMIDKLIPGLAGEGAHSEKMTRVAVFGGILIFIYLSHVLLAWWRDYIAARIGASIIADMRSQFFAHLQRVSLRFYQTHQVGEIMSRLMSDVSRIQSLLTTTLLTFFANVFLLIAIFIYLLQVNWLLTLVALVPVPLTIWLSNRFGIRLHTISMRLQETIAGLSARLQETFLATRTIRAFTQEDTEKKKVDKVLNVLTGCYIKNSVITSLAANLVHFVNMVGPIVVLAWGTYLVADGSIKLGSLIAFYLLLSYLYSPIQDLASINIEVQSAMASVNRIFEYLDLPPAVTEPEKPITLTRPKGAITLKDISFQYEDSGFRIEHLTLDIRPGENLAIVGPSGSGKTTITNLILRFFDPDSGTIMLDGIDIRNLSLKTLRGSIGLVDQDPLLFKTTIFENIAYGNPAATMDMVVKAATIANIHDFIAGQTDGYQTQVGERGVTLSGGEKQRICLARAILTNPPIVILDEATSSLDSNSEQLIQEALGRALADKTAIMIAHRLSTVQHADRIITMDNGRIVAEGTHEELLERSPLYRDLATKQLLV